MIWLGDQGFFLFANNVAAVMEQASPIYGTSYAWAFLAANPRLQISLGNAAHTSNWSSSPVLASNVGTWFLSMFPVSSGSSADGKMHGRRSDGSSV